MKMRMLGIVFAVCAAAVSASAGECFAPGDRASGFVVKSVTDLPEVKGRMVRMEYEKNGAELVWLDRDDDNKTFVVGFRTLPDDDTGVPHIIEHSVLCGSAKYPVKKPFVELMKSSFATFLNACTCADITFYPVCSRNQKDFMNLADVYLDAVFNPLSVRSPLAFRQEGWHYELDGPDGALTRNGVVYSEMKGSYANPMRRVFRELSRLLFPDTTYGFDSGGYPAAIPSLTFEKYKAFYNRFYHPSNARIFLDGKMDVKAMLAKLDGFLSPYERKAVDAAVQFQKPVSAEKTVEYEIADGESTEGKVFVANGWVCGRFDERDKRRAVSLLTAVIAGDNASPLQKALVDTGLCEDVAFESWSDSQIKVAFLATGVKAENVDVVRKTVHDTFARLSEEGLDRARMAAVLDLDEFRNREKDSGSSPRGLALYSDIYHIWNYDGDPADAFRNDAIFASLREKIPTGYFEMLIKDCFMDNPHNAKLTMLPSATLAAERRAVEEKELASIKEGWSSEELNAALSECEELKRHQSEPDSPEDLAKLPRLAVSDIPEEGSYVPREIVDADGVTVIRPHTHANGVVHAECYFSAEDFSAGELADLPVLARVFTSLCTAKHSLDELRNIRDGRLGRFATHTTVFSVPGSGAARPYFSAKVSALESHADDASDFLREVLLETEFGDFKTIGNVLRQKRIEMEQSASGIGGSSFAFRRAAAQLTSRGAVSEIFDGIAQIRHLQELEDGFAEKGPAYAKRLSALAAKLFTRDRLVVCLPDNVPLSWAERLVKSFPSAGKVEPKDIGTFAKRKEGFITTGMISGTALAAHPSASPHSGMAVVAARILSLDYLWDEIRVKGGAYGGRFMVGVDGDAIWLSWNDPNPMRSLGVYTGCGDALRAFADSNKTIDSYIVSAIADTEPYLTPSAETSAAANLWLQGRTPEDRQRVRSEMLRTTKDDLRAFAGKLDSMAPSAATCVVGGSHPLEPCKGTFDRVESLCR